MLEMKPCPFCGKTDKLIMHHRKTRHYDEPLAAIKCNRCGIRGRYQLTEARAITAWNTRAERTCKNETRHIGYGFACSVCEWSSYMPNDYGNDVVFDFNYCPNCGEKVVS